VPWPRCLSSLQFNRIKTQPDRRVADTDAQDCAGNCDAPDFAGAALLGMLRLTCRATNYWRIPTMRARPIAAWATAGILFASFAYAQPAPTHNETSPDQYNAGQQRSASAPDRYAAADPSGDQNDTAHGTTSGPAAGDNVAPAGAVRAKGHHKPNKKTRRIAHGAAGMTAKQGSESGPAPKTPDSGSQPPQN
jgi:hypothetical protein